jgi:hypothetical protein
MIGRNRERGSPVLAGMQRLLRPFAIALVSMAVVACGWEFPGLQPAPLASVEAPAGPLVIVETHGGECPQGACGSKIAIEPDGRVHATDPERVELGILTGATLESLLTEIGKADFAALRSHPFTGTCPVAFDGQETIYTFTTASGAERIATCEIIVDPAAPLFVAVSAAIAGARQP